MFGFIKLQYSQFWGEICERKCIHYSHFAWTYLRFIAICFVINIFHCMLYGYPDSHPNTRDAYS